MWLPVLSAAGVIVVTGEPLRLSILKTPELPNGNPPFRTNGLAFWVVTASKQIWSCVFGLGLMTMVIGSEVRLQSGGAPVVVAVTLSWADCADVPGNFQVMESGFAVGSAITPRVDGVICHR